ncbi:MAG: DUF1893 domain-containing protein [Synergistaceae bacterium]|nr:DUF1893 domain-containing protein [Synergistaceae bacterium]
MEPLQTAIEELSRGGFSCVGSDVDGNTVFVSKEGGLKPLMDRLTEDPNGLRGIYIADKIIGKATACLMIYKGVAACHGCTMSEPASRLLRETGVPFSYGQMVPFIKNKAGTGMCPMERAVEDAVDAKNGYEAIVGFLRNR